MTCDTSPQPISPLRARMIEDMSVHGFDGADAAATMCDTCGHSRPSSAASPDTATAEDVRLFQLHQTRSGVQPPSINGTTALACVSALFATNRIVGRCAASQIASASAASFFCRFTNGFT